MQDARKQSVDADQAWLLLRDATDIFIAKGPKTLHYIPEENQKESILSHALGRSGTLRAPTISIGKTWIVGYNRDLYNKHIR